MDIERQLADGIALQIGQQSIELRRQDLIIQRLSQENAVLQARVSEIDAEREASTQTEAAGDGMRDRRPPGRLDEQPYVDLS